MKIRSIICTALAVFSISGCADRTPAAVSDNYSFTDEMAAYMLAYNKISMAEELEAAGVDMDSPLSGQMKDDGSTWLDYIADVTEKSIRSVLVYSESAISDGYVPDEGMVYKANENVGYVRSQANDSGMTQDEYIKKSLGVNMVTFEAFRLCTEMMALCEGYELYIQSEECVSEDDAETYVCEHEEDFLRYDCLRYSCRDKELADKLAGAESPDEYLAIMSTVSGISLTDRDDNGIPDSIEVTAVQISSDPAGDFAVEEGREEFDTFVSENDGEYTVTMILSLPERDYTPVWNFRMIYISSESSSDPSADAGSYLEQWKEKNGGEKGFSNLASRYSDAPSAYYGGLMSGVAAADMPTREVAAFICSSERKNGDTAMIPDGDSGAYMLYFIDGGEPKWLYDAVQTVKWQRTDEKMETRDAELGEKVTVNSEILRKIAEKIGI